MPELPEVETIRRDLDKEVVTRRIKTVEVKGKRSIRRHKSSPEFKTRLEGKRVASIRRAGKYLLVGLDGDDVLVVHLGMSGQLLRAKGPKDPLDKHTHVIITFTQGGQLRFVDPRTFGEMFVTSTDELTAQVPELAHLGFDPLEDVMSWSRFGQLLAERPTALKTLLMDQKFVAGIGNIYSDEILFAAGLRYDRQSNSLERAGDPTSVPGHGRDTDRGGQAPGVVARGRAVPGPLRRDRRLPRTTPGLRPRGPGLSSVPERGGEGQGERSLRVLVRALPDLIVGHPAPGTATGLLTWRFTPRAAQSSRGRRYHRLFETDG